MKNILIVEDDILLNKTIAYNLALEGYNIKKAYDIKESLRIIKNSKLDLVILDINLPDGNGLDLSLIIKEQIYKPHIIFLTANDTEEDILKGYDYGGTDYITKPFSIAVLIKKIAVLFNKNSSNQNIFDDGFLQVDFRKYIATIGGESIEFTPKEFKILLLFTKNPRMILTKEKILEKIWDIDSDFVDTHTLATTISRIRKKIEIDGRLYIKTSYGLGYQWLGENKDEII